MNKDDITKEQAKQVADAVCRQKAYLYRLRERMEKKGFLPSDPLFVKVSAAYDAVFKLWIDLHYLSCSGAGRKSRPGVGKPSQETETTPEKDGQCADDS